MSVNHFGSLEKQPVHVGMVDGFDESISVLEKAVFIPRNSLSTLSEVNLPSQRISVLIRKPAVLSDIQT